MFFDFLDRETQMKLFEGVGADSAVLENEDNNFYLNECYLNTILHDIYESVLSKFAEPHLLPQFSIMLVSGYWL